MSNDTSIVCPMLAVPVENNIYFYSIVFTVGCILGIWSCALNGVYLICMWKYSSISSISDVFYIVLAITDMLTGALFILPWCCFYMLTLTFTIYCKLYNFMTISGHLLAGIAVFTIAFFLADLYFSLLYPFLYIEKFTIKRALIINMIPWIVTSLMSVVCFITIAKEWYIYQFFAALGTICVMVALFVMHRQIYNELNRLSGRLSQGNMKERKEMSCKRKASKVGIKVLATFCVCFLPAVICYFYNIFIRKTVFVTNYVENVCLLIYFINPVLDPFIYYFRLSRIRVKIQRLFRSNSITEQWWCN